MSFPSPPDPRRELAQARFAVVGSSEAAVVTTGADLVVESWNPAAERLFGYTAGEMVGRSLLDFVPPADRTRARRLVERVRGAEWVQPPQADRPDADDPTAPGLGPAPGGDGPAAGRADRAESSGAGAERELARLRAVVGTMADGVVVADAAGNLLDWNPAALRIHGFGTADEVRRHLSEFARLFALSRPGGSPLPVADWPLARALRGEAFADEEYQVRRLDTGRAVVCAYSGAPVRRGDGAVQLATVTIHDVTARRRLEEQLRQAQKMDAVGQLAGGVAHDFNNLLTVIAGHADLVAAALAHAHPARESVDEIRRTAERAAGLTRQLLTFSRQAVVAPRVVDLNAVVLDVERMLARLLGADIDLATRLEPGLWPVFADPGMVEQVLLNLCVNARDAMPRGGRLTVETANVRLGAEYAGAHHGVRPGAYALLAVADTGAGIPPDVLPHVFEPFFTTKPPGKGTGLGLATVHGIVERFGGSVGVYTEAGVGTTFKVYLPRSEEAARGPSGSVPVPPPRGTETVLLVEDDAAVRALAGHLLREAGYTVIEAASGRDALRAADGHGAPVRLLVTDVVLPGMGGRELAARFRAAHPGARVLFMSGYTDDAVVRHGVLAAEAAFLQKPFTAAGLAHKVRETLDDPAG